MLAVLFLRQSWWLPLSAHFFLVPRRELPFLYSVPKRACFRTEGKTTWLNSESSARRNSARACNAFKFRARNLRAGDCTGASSSRPAALVTLPLPKFAKTRLAGHNCPMTNGEPSRYVPTRLQPFRVLREN